MQGIQDWPKLLYPTHIITKIIWHKIVWKAWEKVVHEGETWGDILIIAEMFGI